MAAQVWVGDEMEVPDKTVLDMEAQLAARGDAPESAEASDVDSQFAVINGPADTALPARPTADFTPGCPFHFSTRCVVRADSPPRADAHTRALARLQDAP